MLGVKAYPREYVDSCRAKVASDIAAFGALKGANSGFEATYFNNLVIVLEAMFVHRLRTLEGKDGNPLNEVRVLVNSLLEHGGELTADKSIKLVSSKSVLGLEYGERVALTREGFGQLSEAFFAEIDAKFS
jgi:hypothetical protein